MKPSLLSRLADRVILQPSRNPIDPEGRRREWVRTPNGKVEVWVTTNQSLSEMTTPRSGEEERSSDPRQDDLPESLQSLGPSPAQAERAPPELVAIKFPGVAGRAERGGPHPFELTPQFNVEIWTVNPLGYGGSEGRAALATIATTCEAVWDGLAQRFPGTPVMVIGNSLGCLSALYLAGRKNVAGVYLRNPVPLQQLIVGRRKYNWWNLGLARWIAQQVPVELDALDNADRAKAPLLMVSSELDRVCPMKYQQAIYSVYAGCKDWIVLQAADHHHPVPDVQVEEYGVQAKRFISKLSGDSA